MNISVFIRAIKNLFFYIFLATFTILRFLLIVSPGFCFVPDAQIFALIFIPADFRISPIELKTPGDCLQIILNGNGVVQAVTIAASLPLRSASGIPRFDSPIKRKTLRSKSDFKLPVMLPHQHGEATTRKSALAIFSPATSASSPAKTHFPQERHFMQPVQAENFSEDTRIFSISADGFFRRISSSRNFSI